jgi:hypothetical protein
MPTVLALFGSGLNANKHGVLDMSRNACLKTFFPLLALFFLWAPIRAIATTVPKMGMETLLQKTSIVFLGMVKDVDPQCEGDKKPCTRVTFVDITVIKGPGKYQELTFFLPEGILEDGTFLKIAGAPHFEPGERYLVFIRNGDWHLTPVTNWFHSVHREVRFGEKDKKRTFFVDYQGRAVVDVNEKGFKLGERIAPPDGIGRTYADSMRGRTGPVYDVPIPFNPQLREAQRKTRFVSEALDAAKLGLNTDEIIKKITIWDRKAVKALPDQEIVIRYRSATSPLQSKQPKLGRWKKAEPEEDLDTDHYVKPETPGAKPSEGKPEDAIPKRKQSQK